MTGVVTATKPFLFFGRSLPSVGLRGLLGFLACGVLGTLGCGAQDQLTALREDFERLKVQSHIGWKTALCSRDARLLLAAVQQECDSGGCDLEIPKESVISTQVCKLDRNRRERFLEILKDQDSATFYLFSNSSALTKEGRDRLKELVLQTKPLPTTRFLVVSRPWAKESEKQRYARQRGQVVVEEIASLLTNHFKQDTMSREGYEPGSVIKKRRTLLWVYEFPLRPTQTARAMAQPIPSKPFFGPSSGASEAAPDDERGVWVFRVDC